ncbi:alpha/beta hydrolase fold domain-containing protein [Cellulosimicrobium sp. BIT-GX5]|uniref:Alpha/beta hydrolase fold domain-containing protein n=1 Tax=Cellulosimicrobium composti TaxID=2672572 RepID=A0A6N7ZEP0_9MICO|nr:alpha/beta hydrolase [Cellulosimicrobium composti]MTG87906.1 alpha/beta hydrolase fold domain-containing protein [Cellulosimicrobium composti]
MDDAQVARLRRDAHERALRRPRLPFAGTVHDEARDGVGLRRYVPEASDAGTAVVFLHGGYGLLGDLELQDGPCRRLATALTAPVVAVDYRLAPEASLAESAEDALTALALLAAEGVGRLALVGDSAGGTVAVAAARRAHGTPLAPAWLALTNPNLDLTLGSFDAARPGGPDLALSAASFRAWTRVEDLADAPRFDLDASALPPTFLAVGDQDALLPEARALAEACARDGVRCELLELPGASHGFLGGDDAPAVLARLRAFVRDSAAADTRAPRP